MLKRLYVDNFRCLEDFELKFDSINLFLGDNGAGKSTVFEVLEKLRAIITTSTSIESTLYLSDCTRWKQGEILKFDIEILGNGGSYLYELRVSAFESVSAMDMNNDHYEIDSHQSNDSSFETIISSEHLWFNQKPLLSVYLDNVEIYSDNEIKHHSSRYNYFQSILPLLKASENNQKIIWFRERIKRLSILQITPNSIVSESSVTNQFLTRKLENYVSWYRYVFSENHHKLIQLTESLQEILAGFIGFKLERISEKAVILKLVFKTEDSDHNIEYIFEELSDGQKVLVVLYSLFYGLESQDYTLCIDEPDNFLALPEIQPWLFKLEDLCNEGKLQALLISHHPELINYLLASPIGYWFERQANSSVKVKPINSELQKCNESGLSMSELIARRWLDD
ncbi:MAG: AAA family ATPase [Microcystaceae cyanobacterium]